MIGTYFDNILETLSLSFAVSSFNVRKLRIAKEEGFIRVRCTLSNGDTFEFAEYVKIIDDKPKIQSYNYHWQNSNGSLVKRWDNVGHHPEIASFPHHLHQSDGRVNPSSPMNFQQVLLELETSIRAIG